MDRNLFLGGKFPNETWDVTLVYLQKITIYLYITTYPPSGARAFNAARTALHTLRERIHFPCKAHHGKFRRSPRPTCAAKTKSQGEALQPVSFHTACPQVSHVLRDASVIRITRQKSTLTP